MPCFSFCKGKEEKPNVELTHKNGWPQSGGEINPSGPSPEETILELKSQNESLKRIANQATRDLTVSF